MSDIWFMKQPCKHCPFRRDVRPFLRPERAEEIAGSAWNKYNEFPCHKTTVSDDDDDGQRYSTSTSLACHGFLAMQINEAGSECPEGFSPSHLIYEDPYEMIDAYQAEADGEWEPFALASPAAPADMERN